MLRKLWLILIRKGEPSPSDSGVDPDQEIAIINYWLDNCKNNHADCGSGEPRFMPTRVVDVGLTGNEEPRLVLTAELDFTECQSNTTARSYLALSHCWGLAVPTTATTTSSTITERLRGIPMAGLSRTFADFIGIARRMHVRYVWIDSLCIIQDSREDWEKEAAQMASVYSNAYCTIAASSSSNGNGGCRRDPDSEPYGPVILSFIETDEHGNENIQKVRVFSLFGKAITSILQEDPLSTRGWTFQERELSSRILHYSKDTIRWECRALKASLQFPWQDTNGFNGSLRTFDVGQIGPRNPDQKLREKQKEKDQEAWFEAVQRYTGRALTKKTDALHAFSGIARAVQSHTRDRYLAGLWYSNLIHCLCWCSAWYYENDPIFYRQMVDPKTYVRQSEYLAPSWSWACITGHVRYEPWIFGALDPDPSPKAASFMPRILEATTVPVGLDEYGSLKEGRIRLVGKMKPAFTCGEGVAGHDCEAHRVYDVHKGQMRAVGSIKYDIPSEALAGKLKVIICLCMLPLAERNGDSVGLALVPTGVTNEYRRVGLISLVKLAWFEDSAEGEITIV